MEQHGTTWVFRISGKVRRLAEAQLDRRANIRLKYMVGISMGSPREPVACPLKLQPTGIQRLFLQGGPQDRP